MKLNAKRWEHVASAVGSGHVTFLQLVRRGDEYGVFICFGGSGNVIGGMTREQAVHRITDHPARLTDLR